MTFTGVVQSPLAGELKFKGSKLHRMMENMLRGDGGIIIQLVMRFLMRIKMVLGYTDPFVGYVLEAVLWGVATVDLVNINSEKTLFCFECLRGD